MKRKMGDINVLTKISSEVDLCYFSRVFRKGLLRNKQYKIGEVILFANEAKNTGIATL